MAVNKSRMTNGPHYTKTTRPIEIGDRVLFTGYDRIGWVVTDITDCELMPIKIARREMIRWVSPELIEFWYQKEEARV